MKFHILVIFGILIGLDPFKTLQETLILPFLGFLYFLVFVLKKVRVHHNPIKKVSKNHPSRKKEKVKSEIQRQTSDLRAADFNPSAVPWLSDARLTRRNDNFWAKNPRKLWGLFPDLFGPFCATSSGWNDTPASRQFQRVFLKGRTGRKLDCHPRPQAG
jgi:hypothetical protein